MASRKYRTNRKQIFLKGDGPGKNGSISISAINESRKRRAVEASQNASASIKRAIEFISEYPDSAFKQVADMEAAVTKQFDEGFFGKSASLDNQLDMAVGSMIGSGSYSGAGSAGRKLRMAAKAYFSVDVNDEQKSEPAKSSLDKADEMAGLKAQMGQAIGELASILGAKKNLTREEESQIIPVMSKIFRIAAKMGYIKFKESAQFVMKQIRSVAGDEVADKLSIENLQAGFVNVSKEIGGDKKEALAFDSIEEVMAAEDESLPEVRSAPRATDKSDFAQTSETNGTQPTADETTLEQDEATRNKEATPVAEPVTVNAENEQKKLATFEEGKTALRIIGDPAFLKDRLDALGIKSVPRKDGVNVPDKKRWADARANIPVSIEQRTVDGVPARLADVTIETMENGNVRLISPAETGNYASADEAIRFYRESYKGSPETVEAPTPAAEAKIPAVINKPDRRTKAEILERMRELVEQERLILARRTNEQNDYSDYSNDYNAIKQEKAALNKEYGAITEDDSGAEIPASLEDKPVHIENGEVELATPAVVEKSLKKSVAMTAAQLKDALAWLNKQIDAAMMDAHDGFLGRDKDTSTGDALSWFGDGGNKEIPKVTFDVPNDGTFKIPKFKGNLARFKERVKTGVFVQGHTPKLQKVSPAQKTTSGGTESTIKDFIDGGDYITALEYSKQIEKPIIFGWNNPAKADHPIAYSEAKPYEPEGFDDFKFVSVKDLFSGRWAIIDMSSGLSVTSNHSTRAYAISGANSALAPNVENPEKTVTPEKIHKLIAGSFAKDEAGTQEQLEAKWRDWAETGEKVAQKRIELERAQLKDKEIDAEIERFVANGYVDVAKEPTKSELRIADNRAKFEADKAKYAAKAAEIKAKQAERAIVPLSEITVTLKARIAESNEMAEYDEKADVALKEIDNKTNLARSLIKCLAS